jgi:hypothetical protein
MAHHVGQFPFEENTPEELRKLMEEMGIEKTQTKSKNKGLGALGTFPDGKIAEKPSQLIAKLNPR